MTSTTLLHVINTLSRGGAEILLRDTIKLLPEYEHVLVTLAPPDDLLNEMTPWIKAFYCLNALAPSKWPKGIVALRRIINRHDPLLVHAHLQIAGIIAKLACPSKVPLFYSLHSPFSLDAFQSNRWALPLERLTSRRYHHVIAVSNHVLEDYQCYVNIKGTANVVHNMVNGEFFNHRSVAAYSPGQPLRCVCVGNLVPAKNYPFLLRSFTQLRDLPITLDIFGAFPNDAGPHSIYPESTTAPNVRFMGESAQIIEALPQYHVYIAGSSYEGFGLALLEAMAIGIAALASNIPAFREVGGHAIKYFDLNNKENLVSILKSIFSGCEELRPLAESGRQRALQIAHPKSYKTSLLQVYNAYL